MKSPKTYLIVLLALTTGGGAVLAWRQYQELIDLRAAAMNREERADLQKKIWELQRANRDLEARLGAPRTRTAGEPDEGARGGRGGPGGPGGRPESGIRQASAMRELANKPEFQVLMSSQQKSAIERTYAALFHTLNLTPDQIERVKTLLAERQTTTLDVMEAARAQGIDPRENQEEFRKLIESSRNEINASIRAAIGETAYAQLANYEQTLPQRGVVNELQQRLAYSGSSLSLDQENQLVQILAANQPARTTGQNTAGPGGASRGPGDLGGGMRVELGGIIGAVFGGGPGANFASPMGGVGGAPITSEAVTQAQAILTPPQATALQQLQQQQQAQQQIRQLVNDTLSNNAGVPPPPRPRGGK